MKKTLFLERDGTIIKEPDDRNADPLAKLVFIPGVISALAKIAAETDYELVMVLSNDMTQAPSFPEKTSGSLHLKMLEILRGEGVTFKEVIIDGVRPAVRLQSCTYTTEMLTKYLSRGTDLDNSYFIGDRKSVSRLAHRLDCRVICMSAEEVPGAVLSAKDWNEIYRFLKDIPRRGSVSRNTGETKINVAVNLDGTGRYHIKTASGFFSHMLEQFARHSGIDLMIEAAGDTFVDEHHLIEDTGISLGEAFASALGRKKGIERYGFVVPMDDSLAQASVDFGGRSWLLWQVDFKTEKIGTMPTEMVYHFFRSFSDGARCNISIKAEGVNEHHKAEAIFKAFARAVGMAVRKTGSNELPTTKGLL